MNYVALMVTNWEYFATAENITTAVSMPNRNVFGVGTMFACQELFRKRRQASSFSRW